ncbi:uncharacterized protein LOC131328830 isoform X3 [Rhododendron vialii]|nr:uncharacterized protein LOC131328830 isoform X3 [Rhododendron vialii]XP_058217743.1 uncharacterized protein LOC131328830 isoform X3 [Rhododendron vialii]
MESAGRHVPIVFLERIRDEFTQTYGSGKAATAAANSLNMEFGPKLKEHMQWCGDHSEEISKLAVAFRKLFFEDHSPMLEVLYRQQKGKPMIWISILDYLGFFLKLTKLEKNDFDKLVIEKGIKVSTADGSESRSLFFLNRYFWVRPPSKWWKVNVDGSVLQSGVSGVGLAFRDDEGKLGPVYSMPIGNKKDAFEAEFEAMVFGVNFAIYHNFLNLVLESDCKQLCRYLWGMDPIPPNLLPQFLGLRLDELTAYSISLVPRNANRVADNLATAATCNSNQREKKMWTARFCASREEKGKPYYTVNRKYSTRCTHRSSTRDAPSDDFIFIPFFFCTVETNSSPRLPLPQQKILSLPLWIREIGQHHLLESLYICDALKCATALLEGKLGGIRLDLDGDHLLHRVARFCSLKLVQLFLHLKARSDTRYSDYSYDHGEDLTNGLRPLDIAFNFARNQYTSLESYSFGGQSTFEMILYLCQLRVGNIGDTIKFLACSSKDVAKEAYHCARKGKLTELALLLIVAREKILVPINLDVKGGVGSSGRTTILHWLQFQILILTHEEKLMGDCKNGKLTKIRRKKMVMRSAALLLEVFERAGHAIEEIIQYLSRSPCVRSEELEKHAVFVLKEAGFEFKNGDFDFSTMDRFDITLTDSSRTRTRNGTPTKDAPSAETNSSPRMPLPQQKIPSLSLWGVSPWSSAQTFPLHQTRGLTSTDKSHYTNHMKQTEPIVQNVPQWLPKFRLARFARLLRRGMKIA